MTAQEMVEAAFAEMTTPQAQQKMTPSQREEVLQMVLSAPLERLVQSLGIELGRHVVDTLHLVGVRPSDFAMEEALFVELTKRLQKVFQADGPLHRAYVEMVGSRG